MPFPVLTAWRSLKANVRDRAAAGRGVKDSFTQIHAKNVWGSSTSVSGPGSEVRETEEVRKLLPDLIRRLEVKILLDAPCGDFAWMSSVDIGDCHYIGADVVEALILEDRKLYSCPNREFLCADLTCDTLPRADLVMCRDCLIHLSFKHAKQVIANFRNSKSTYLLATTNPGVKDNWPIVTGGFRNLNLCLPPFRFPKPIELHRDRYFASPGEPMVDPDKHLGLWRIADLPVS